MRASLPLLIATLALFGGVAETQAQWLNPGAAGDFHLDPLLLPGSVTVGNGTNINEAALLVRADQLTTPPTAPAGGGGTWFNLFRTVVPTGNNGRWEAFRNTLQLGSIYTTANANGFHIQANQNNGAPPGILWLENNTQDGIMIRANGGQAGLLNTYPLQLDGFASVGIRAGGTNGMPSRARWHLVDWNGQAVVEPWRPYFRNGVLFSGNNDMAFIGHAYHDASNGTTPWTYTLDRSDLVISAGENNMTEALRQRIRFTYTTAPVVGTTTGAASYNGLEFMQCWPENATEGFVGIGDWNAATVANGGVQVNPTERLDLLDRTVRARRIVPDYNNNALDKLLVIDDNGRFHWRAVSTLPAGGGTGCDWDLNIGGNAMTTATDLPGTGSCPELDWSVGIGLLNPTWKLEVTCDAATYPTLSGGIYTSVIATGGGTKAQGIQAEVFPNPGLLTNEGLAIQGDYFNPGARGHGVRGVVHVDDPAVQSAESWGVEGTTEISNGVLWVARGVCGQVLGPGIGQPTVNTAMGVEAVVTSTNRRFSDSYGVRAIAGGAVNKTYGVYGEATWDNFGDFKYGVAGVAKGNYDVVNGSNIGVYGEAFVNSPNTSWAGYFRGNVNLDGDLYQYGTLTIISDGALKQNVQSIQSPLALVSALAPVSYQFNTADNPLLNLSAGDHFGFIAQDVQAVAPSLVKPVHRSAVFDSLGVMIEPPVDYLGMNYIEVIPLLVGAIKEQQAQLAAMQQALDACCVGVPTDGQLFQGQGNNTGTGTQDLARFGAEDLLTIAPNPFEERTTISYRNATPGRVMLRVSDGRGQHIDTLRDAMQDAGAFTYEWNTVDLAPGMYTVSLLLDGQLLVERAVKVGR